MTQADRIGFFFKNRPKEWIPLPEVMKFAAQYNSRIKELRESGMTIINKTKDIHGVKCSWYMYLPDGQKELF